MAFTAAPTLPDEIISEIISPVLRISDKDFENALDVESPFATFSESTSALLVICKAWLRVATPLLYNTVVLRSKAQAAALQAALHANNDLGAFIKRLRVEGGFGAPMRTILQLSPNITDLFVVVSLWSSESTTGLCAGLTAINPRRLIIQDTYDIDGNKQNRELVKVLGRCISKTWSKLKSIHLPYSIALRRAGGRCAVLYEAVTKSESIEEILAVAPHFYEQTDALAIMRDMVKWPTIKRIVLAGYIPLVVDDDDDDFSQHLQRDDALKNVVVLQSAPGIRPHLTESVSQPHDPHFVPLSAASEAVKDHIWGRVLYFAMENDRSDSAQAASVEAYRSRPIPRDEVDAEERSAYLRVCKRFASVGRPQLYRHLQIFYSDDMASLLASLKSSPQLAAHVQSLGLAADALYDAMSDSDSDSAWESGSEASQSDETSPPPPPRRTTLSGLLSRLPNLKLLDNSGIQTYPPSWASYVTACIGWEEFEIVARVSASALEAFLGFRILAKETIQSPIIFEAFGALRSLDWCCMTEFAGDWSTGAVVLPKLECLALGSFHSSFLTMMAAAELPALRRVYFYCTVPAAADTSRRRFLQVHHSKLVELRATIEETSSSSGKLSVLDLCPDLPLFIYGCKSPIMYENRSDMEERIIMQTRMEEELVQATSRPARLVRAAFDSTALKPKSPHLKLEKIIIQLAARVKAEIALCEIDPKLFPALRTVQIADFYWPTTERDIASEGAVIEVAEALLKSNVAVMDGRGAVWRPRLKRRK
ncbi:hypothetical protein MKEN_00029600 [Mycena kentingensis (nom. inval.)]|nr:hypothetical protein MKEN_00029600 [Mycena kentingensis (nom. inval.)]